MADRKIHILFICNANSCRSQMAEAFAEKYKGDIIEAFSAGNRPGPTISRNVIKVMAEAGFDMIDYYPKHIDDLAGLKFDYVIVLCDSLKQIGLKWPAETKVIYKNFEDPTSFIGSAEETLTKFRQVRDMIKDYVMTLPESLEQ